jgi:hypothetical protein
VEAEIIPDEERRLGKSGIRTVDEVFFNFAERAVHEIQRPIGARYGHPSIEKPTRLRIAKPKGEIAQDS